MNRFGEVKNRQKAHDDRISRQNQDLRIRWERENDLLNTTLEQLSVIPLMKQICGISSRFHLHVHRNRLEEEGPISSHKLLEYREPEAKITVFFERMFSVDGWVVDDRALIEVTVSTREVSVSGENTYTQYGGSRFGALETITELTPQHLERVLVKVTKQVLCHYKPEIYCPTTPPPEEQSPPSLVTRFLRWLSS